MPRDRPALRDSSSARVKYFSAESGSPSNRCSRPVSCSASASSGFAPICS